jgi:hypothetical protein
MAEDLALDAGEDMWIQTGWFSPFTCTQRFVPVYEEIPMVLPRPNPTMRPR